LLPIRLKAVILHVIVVKAGDDKFEMANEENVLVS